ncbi:MULTISPECIES: nicotinate (nicotinamide) nucleotide adenylyltransferase [unclassified Cetobacterium]|uniref:nicotinate (nicotinamide) nucleotide adenylyltransferase n=1 Tax=unclassified Cetobacterium TaxID=2630983 RepID=UPI00064884C9|nr:MULTISPECIES: nicotinate (nicotinamide) nucleotide adenylyltransferase [unclassified Cetobacterium]
MKVGIYGGSFNPIHNGHVYIAKLVLEELKLDKLLIIPVGNPSHRENLLLDGKLRLEMCRLAFENERKIEVSDIEISSDEVCYTYDTLLKVMELYPDCEYFEIIGEDSGAYFQKWKNYEEILKLSKVVILQRKGYETTLKNSNIIHIKNKFFNFSSTEVRDAIKEGKTIACMVPSKVERFIKNNKLYNK